MWFKFPKTLLLEQRVSQLEEEIRERREREAELINKIVLLAGLNPMPKFTPPHHAETPGVPAQSPSKEEPARKSLTERREAALLEWRTKNPQATQ
jgi:hypothetical protein